MMTDLELREHRRRKWRLDGLPLRSPEEAREFLESVGFCLMYPVRTVLLPTLLGACAGSDDKLPARAQAFQDPRARAAEELALALVKEKAAFESNLMGETALLLAPSVLPYFYALVGDRNPKAGPKAAEKLSPLARDAWTVFGRGGPLSKAKLREALGGASSDAALERVLGELAGALRITRVDVDAWELLYRWAPAAVKQGTETSVGEALSALVSRYLDSVVAAEAGEVEEFFSHMAPRSRVRESINALLAARELAFVPVGKKTFIQLAPEFPPVTFRHVMPAGVHGKPKGGAPRRRPAARQDRKR